MTVRLLNKTLHPRQTRETECSYIWREPSQLGDEVSLKGARYERARGRQFGW